MDGGARGEKHNTTNFIIPRGVMRRRGSGDRDGNGNGDLRRMRTRIVIGD